MFHKMYPPLALLHTKTSPFCFRH